jgi:phage shock protein E
MRVIIDVREPSEYAKDHVEGAINIPPSKFIDDNHVLDDIPKNAEIILYCRSGSRSNVAINILQAKGFTNLTNGINKELVLRTI